MGNTKKNYIKNINKRVTTKPKLFSFAVIITSKTCVLVFPLFPTQFPTNFRSRSPKIMIINFTCFKLTINTTMLEIS
jgi:hypothetical protein